MDEVKHYLQTSAHSTHLNDGITIVPSRNTEAGIQLAKNLLYTLLDKKTALFLSGGRTPKDMYTALAQEAKLSAGTVGLIDERYGQPFHDNSNEKMIKDTGLLGYLEKQNIRFYPILQPDLSREDTALSYDETLRSLIVNFPKSVGILGVGLDGHTAGIAGNRPDFHNPLFDDQQKNLWVSSFDDPEGMFKERVTMTFLGLSMLDVLLVLVFGDDKKEALENIFREGPSADGEEEIPARFFKRPEIAKKTLLITDQKL